MLNKVNTMDKVDEHPSHLYPSLGEGVDYRLQEVSRLREELKNEIGTRETLYKKYKRAVNTLDGVDTGATALSIVLGGVGTGLLTTLIGIPLVPIILGVAAGFGLVGAGTKFATRKLRAKALKHDQIRVLAETKLNSITDLVSKSLHDGIISYEEFELIVKEAQRYQDLKKNVKIGTRKKILHLDEVTKKELIEQGRKEARHSLIQKLGDGNSH